MRRPFRRRGKSKRKMPKKQTDVKYQSETIALAKKLLGIDAEKKVKEIFRKGDDIWFRCTKQRFEVFIIRFNATGDGQHVDKLPASKTLAIGCHNKPSEKKISVIFSPAKPEEVPEELLLRELGIYSGELGWAPTGKKAEFDYNPKIPNDFRQKLTIAFNLAFKWYEKAKLLGPRGLY